MKSLKNYLVIFVLSFISTREVSAQVEDDIQVTPGGMFDLAYDRFGNSYNIEDLVIGGRVTSTNSLLSISSTCGAGYFKLHFQQGSIFDKFPSMKTVACQVFTDVSALITSNTPTSSINIYCDETYQNNVFAYASSYYVFPTFPFNPNQGIIDSQVYKALISGTNPYLNIPLNFHNASQMYHANVSVSASTMIPWSFSTGSSTIASTDYDFYTILLHEVMHLLGFNSAIGEGGYSTFGKQNNYFVRYDQFLYDYQNNPLLVSSTQSSCPTSNLVYGSTTTVGISPSLYTNTNTPINTTSCNIGAKYIGATTVTVYTPSGFEPGSSLSHFEDICTYPSTFTSACTPTPSTGCVLTP